jgi:hypothetical protein
MMTTTTADSTNVNPGSPGGEDGKVLVFLLVSPTALAADPSMAVGCFAGWPNLQHRLPNQAIQLSRICSYRRKHVQANHEESTVEQRRMFGFAPGAPPSVAVLRGS